MWTEKRVLSIIVLAAVIVLLIMIPVTVSVAVRPEGEYYRYTYDAVTGEFISSNARITIDKNDRFAMFDNAGDYVTVTGVGCKGEYSEQNNGVNIRVENMGTVIYSKFFIKNGNYIIDPLLVTPQISDSIYTEKDKLEGYYNLNLNGSAAIKYLNKGKIYSSVNNTTDPASFTKQEGTYDQRGDFLTIIDDSGISRIMLVLEFINLNGEPNKGLATTFYSKRNIRTKAPSVTGLELESRNYAKVANNQYEIKVIKYPTKKEADFDSITIRTDATSLGGASVSGKVITCNGIGNITLDIRMGDNTLTRTISIVDLTLITPAPNLNEKVAYDYTTFTTDNPPASAILATGVACETSVIGSHGDVTFIGKGSAIINVSATWSETKLDGSIKYVTITRTVTVTVV